MYKEITRFGAFVSHDLGLVQELDIDEDLVLFYKSIFETEIFRAYALTEGSLSVPLTGGASYHEDYGGEWDILIQPRHGRFTDTVFYVTSCAETNLVEKFSHIFQRQQQLMQFLKDHTVSSNIKRILKIQRANSESIEEKEHYPPTHFKIFDLLFLLPTIKPAFDCPKCKSSNQIIRTVPVSMEMSRQGLWHPYTINIVDDTPLAPTRCGECGHVAPDGDFMVPEKSQSKVEAQE